MDLEYRVGVHTDMLALPMSEVKRPPTDGEKQLISEYMEEGYVTRGIVLAERGTGLRYSVVGGQDILKSALKAGFDQVPTLIADTFRQELIELLALPPVLTKDTSSAKQEDHIEKALRNYSVLTGSNLSFRKAVQTQNIGPKSTLYTDKRLVKDLAVSVQKMVKEGVIGKSVARSISYVKGKEKQIALATKAAKNGWTVKEVDLERRKSRDKPKTKALTRDLAPLKNDLELLSGCRVEVRPKTKLTGTLVFKVYGLDALASIIDTLKQVKGPFTYNVSGSSELNKVSTLSINYSEIDVIDQIKSALSNNSNQ